MTTGRTLRILSFVAVSSLIAATAGAQDEECRDLDDETYCTFSVTEDGVTPDIYYASRADIADAMSACLLLDPRVLRCLAHHEEARVRANVRWLYRYIAVQRRSPERARAMLEAARRHEPDSTARRRR